MPHKPENPGTCAYYGETIPKRSVLFDKLPEMVALSERRSRRDVKSVWTANTAKGIGPRTPRKGLDREDRERDWTAKTAKGREGREGVRAFRDISRFSRSNVPRSEMNHDPTSLAEGI